MTFTWTFLADSSRGTWEGTCSCKFSWDLLRSGKENKSLCCLSCAWREQHKARKPGIRVTPGCTAQMWLVRWGREGRGRRNAVDWDQLGGRVTYSQHLSLVTYLKDSKFLVHAPCDNHHFKGKTTESLLFLRT